MPTPKPYSTAAGALLAFLLASGLASAQAQSQASNPVFVIKGFEITGENPLSQSQTTQVLAPYLRSDATIDTLQKATAALEAALKAGGFALHRVALPAQEVGNKVTLNIVKFVIGKVSIEGASAYSSANIRASLPELQEGSAPNFGKLAVQTAIANENPGKQVQVGLKEADEADKIDVRIVVKESRPWSFSAALANTGSSATGNDRLSLVGAHANVLGLDHQFSGAYTTSIERSSDVKQLGLNYRIPLYGAGGVLGLSYTRSDVVGNFGAFSSTGAGQTAGLNYSHYLAPVGGRRSYLSVGLDDKQFEVTKISGVPVPGQLLRASRPLSLGYTARVESDTAVWGYNAELAANLSGGAGNDLVAYQSEDARISTANWKLLRAGANYLSSFASGWLWSARTQLQYSADALISGEQFGLGGASSVRGTTERPIAGDSGVFASLELSTPELHRGLRLVGFVDAGQLANNNPNGNPKPAHDRLASAGLGLRYAAGAIGFSAEWAQLTSASVLPFVVGSGIPQVGDQKLHLNLTARF